jgi:hypothetical protein
VSGPVSQLVRRSFGPFWDEFVGFQDLCTGIVQRLDNPEISFNGINKMKLKKTRKLIKGYKV